MSKTKWPPQIKYIIGNEGCERYSYYGMRAILTVFMVNTLMFQKEHATEVMHAFMGAIIPGEEGEFPSEVVNVVSVKINVC